MGHHINALIGSRQSLSGLASRLGPPDPTELALGFVIVPLDEQRLDALAMSIEDAFDGFTYLKPAMASEIGRALNGGRAIYIETEYFGGMGGQGAALFEDGALVWRGAQSNIESAPRKSWFSRIFNPARGPRPKSPISQGLSMLGVVPLADEDEFDRMGLGRFRSLEMLGFRDED